MKIVILGKNGQLGKTLFKELENSFKIIAYTKNQIDITSNASLQKLLKVKPNIIINCAAYTNVEASELNQNLANAVNKDALKYLSTLCKKINSLLIHFSTDYVFDGSKLSDYLENDHTNPLNKYGKSKLEGEKEIIISKCNYIIIRISWLFSEYGNNFYQTILNQLTKMNQIKVIDNQYGKPTSCMDLSKAIKQLVSKLDINKNYQKIYHYSGGAKVTWFQFAKYIQKEYQKKSKNKIHNLIFPISFKDFNSKVTRPVNSSLCGSLIREEFGIKSGNWKNGIRELIKI